MQKIKLEETEQDESLSNEQKSIAVSKCKQDIKEAKIALKKRMKEAKVIISKEYKGYAEDYKKG